MKGVNFLLDRLEKVKQLSPKKHAESYTALCPAHNDRSPSLCIDLAHNGKILIFCRAGCGVGDVLAAVGIRVTALKLDLMQCIRRSL